MLKLERPEPVAPVSRGTERELRVALAIQQAVLDAADDGIVVTDEWGRIAAVNQRFIEMWDMPPGVRAASDFSAWAVWGASQCREPAGADHDRAAMQSTTPHTAVITLNDGRAIAQRSQPQVIDGRIAGRIWCYRDLGKRTQVEDKRGKGEVRVQHGHKLESLGVLAGGIAHDFNNLLVGILGHTGIALMEIPSDSPLLARVEAIQTAAQSAAELVNQMLAYSGQGRFVVRPCDLSEIAAEMFALLRTAGGGIETELRIRPDVPAVNGDAAQIRQVIMNLMTNAADAIEDGNGRVVLTTGSMQADAGYLADARIGHDAAPGEFVFVEVKDTGCGMDQATSDRMFEPFFTTKFTGRGLGLAAVLGIVRGHQGAITVTSVPGEGTTFRVLLPASAASDGPAPAAPTPPAVSHSARVLVVDDEQPVLRVASEMLRRAGYTVATAASGQQALELASQPGVAFDVVLLDMTMPKMNGAETCRRLRLLHPGLPVVLMSGYTSEEAVSRFGEEGLNGFVQKPFMPAALVKSIADALAQRDGGGGNATATASGRDVASRSDGQNDG